MTDSPMHKWLERVDKSHGFSSKTGPEDGQASSNVKVINFDEDEEEPVTVPVHTGDPGIAPAQQIANILQHFVDAIQNYWSNYGDGLHNFSESMQFESDQAAEPQHLKAVFKELAKKAFDDAIGEIASRAGPWGQLIHVTKTAVSAWAAESERAAAAAGGVIVRDYIARIRNGIAGQRDQMIAAARGQQRPLIQEFEALAAGDVSGGQPTSDGRIVGEAATILNQLEAGVTAFQRAMPSASRFQQLFTRNFADTPGWTGPISHGARLSGTLYFEMELVHEPGDSGGPGEWSISDRGRAWKLVTKSPNSDRVASSLAASLEGKKPWEIDLPKMVKMRIEIEESGLNSYQTGYIRFTSSPTSFEVRTNYGDTYFRQAWALPTIRQVALGATRLIGGSE